MPINAGDILFRIGGNTDDLKRALKDADMSIAGTSKAMLGMGVAIAGGLTYAAASAASFGREMAQIRTLGVKDMDALSEAIKGASQEFGIGLSDAARAAYQAISSGVSELEAPRILAQAAKSATANLASMADTIVLGTAVTNAFGLEMKNINDVFDAAFVAVQDGVTEMDQLAGSVGKAAPLFSAAGLSADEMFGSIAALTKGGVATAEAVTGLNAVISGIITPSGQAAEAARALGLNFNAAGLEALGLQGFMLALNEATGGNLQVMSSLFPSVEALKTALALSGAQADNFATIMDHMADKVGKTDAAFKLFTENNAAFAFDQAKASAAALSVELGEVLLPNVTKLLDAINPMIKATSDWTNSNKELTTNILGVSAGTAALLFAMGGLGLAFKPVVALFKIALAVVGPLGIAYTALGAELLLIWDAFIRTAQALDRMNESTQAGMELTNKYAESVRGTSQALDEQKMMAMTLDERIAYINETSNKARIEQRALGVDVDHTGDAMEEMGDKTGSAADILRRLAENSEAAIAPVLKLREAVTTGNPAAWINSIADSIMGNAKPGQEPGSMQHTKTPSAGGGGSGRGGSGGTSFGPPIGQPPTDQSGEWTDWPSGIPGWADPLPGMSGTEIRQLPTEGPFSPWDRQNTPGWSPWDMPGWNPFDFMGLDVPKFATGGMVARGGMIDIHKDERVLLPTGAEVLPRQHSALGSSMMGAGGPPQININVTGNSIRSDADIGELSSRIAKDLSRNLRGKGFIS